MHTTELPINQILGIHLARDDDAHLLELKESTQLLNHVGTVHASGQFALAEACSGEFLLQHLGALPQKTNGVLRAAEVKFRKPAHGTLRATPGFAEGDAKQLMDHLHRKGRALASVNVEVTDAHGVMTMRGQYDWFLQSVADVPAAEDQSD